MRSVEKAIETIEAEIIVVDNNSSDESCKMIKEQFAHIKLIENNKNVGFAIANNQAVKIAKGEYVCILNPDTVVAEDTFTKILKFAKTQENLGIIGCRLIDGTGIFLPESKRNIPTVKVATRKLLGFSKNYYANQVSEFDIAEASVFVGAFMFLKREVYNTLNGFDEDFFMYGEDIDLSYRVLKSNYKNYYFGETSILHFKGESTLKDKKYAKRFFEAMQIFYKKHFKKHFVFDVLVNIGLKTANIFNSKPSKVKKVINNHIIVSTIKNLSFNFSYKPEQMKLDELELVPENSEIIFDANTIAYKDIINKMDQYAVNLRVTFKILPNKSRFIIGSNDSVNQGEVIEI